jgi:hypothetical protein
MQEIICFFQTLSPRLKFSAQPVSRKSVKTFLIPFQSAMLSNKHLSAAMMLRLSDCGWIWVSSRSEHSLIGHRPPAEIHP